MFGPNLLVISDLHLGEDVGSSIRTTEELEQALVGFLDHHREAGGPWRLVINGDMLELVGIVMLPDDAPSPTGELHRHDRRYGLGGRQLAAQIKMRAMVEHHAVVFDALARFVAAGHTLSVVIGNHDIELYWPEAQRTFVDGIVEGWARQNPGPRTPPTDAELRERVTFHPWFVYEPQMAWIEHGHQYDSYCSFAHLLDPAIDKVEVDPNIGGLLLRYLGSQFGDEAHAVVHQGTLAYIRLWLSLGPLRMFGVFAAYFDMCLRLFEHHRTLRPSPLAEHADRVAEQLGAVESTSPLDKPTLERLTLAWQPPLANRLGRLVRGLMCDRVALLIGAPTALAVYLMAPGEVLAAALSLPMGLLAVASAVPRVPTDPRQPMRDGAAWVRAQLGVPVVVMGHSHDPVHEVSDNGAYLNTGTWAPRGDPRNACTHVTVVSTADGVRATLRQWRDGRSVPFDPTRRER